MPKELTSLFRNVSHCHHVLEGDLGVEVEAITKEVMEVATLEVEMAEDMVVIEEVETLMAEDQATLVVDTLVALPVVGTLKTQEATTTGMSESKTEAIKVVVGPAEAQDGTKRSVSLAGTTTLRMLNTRSLKDASQCIKVLLKMTASLTLNILRGLRLQTDHPKRAIQSTSQT